MLAYWMWMIVVVRCAVRHHAFSVGLLLLRFLLHQKRERSTQTMQAGSDVTIIIWICFESIIGAWCLQCYLVGIGLLLCCVCFRHKKCVCVWCQNFRSSAWTPKNLTNRSLPKINKISYPVEKKWGSKKHMKLLRKNPHIDHVLAASSQLHQQQTPIKERDSIHLLD